MSDWTAPQLIILTRTTPDENVLRNCKSTTRSSGPSNYNNACGKQASCAGHCNQATTS